MAERTIYIRPDPLRVVVKPHPRGVGTNLLHAPSREAAYAHAAKLSEQFDWPIVDET